MNIPSFSAFSSRETRVSSRETSVSSREMSVSSRETRVSSREKRDATGNLLLTSTVHCRLNCHVCENICTALHLSDNIFYDIIYDNFSYCWLANAVMSMIDCCYEKKNLNE